jgi:signal transduction histidine kinase
MKTLVSWVPGFLRIAFEGGPAGRRRVVLLAFATLGPISTLAAAVLTDGSHLPRLGVRLAILAVALTWLLLRKEPTQAEWLVLWTLMIAAWVAVQLAVGPAYNSVFAINGMAFLTLVCLVFDTFIIAYACALGIAGYAVAAFHQHPFGKALVMVVMMAVGESLLAVIVHGTAAYLRACLRDVGVLHTRMVQAADRERSRISGELHDDTVQVLTAIGLRMDTLINRLERGEPAGRSLAAARQLRVLVGEATDRTRRLSFNLYPPQLDHRGLAPALDALGDEIARDAELAVYVSAPVDRYPLEVERLAYRTIRELLLNAHKHADASRVLVVVAPDVENDAVRCEVRDDGRGFDAREVAAARADFHTGLDAAASRIRVCGGDFEITSRPFRGTTASFSIPLANVPLGMSDGES